MGCKNVHHWKKLPVFLKNLLHPSSGQKQQGKRRLCVPDCIGNRTDSSESE
jgi:hypothetical protein